MAASFAQILGNKRIALMLPLGFASGLPLALTSGTLQAWLTVAGVDLKTIGIFTLVGLPYSLKFLWAPLMDRIAFPWLGRRRGWFRGLCGNVTRDEKCTKKCDQRAQRRTSRLDSALQNIIFD